MGITKYIKKSRMFETKEKHSKKTRVSHTSAQSNWNRETRKPPGIKLQ